MISALTLVSLNPDRAVIGHAQRDRLTAEMALGHLVQLFERTLGRRIAVSIMQIKDAPSLAAPSARSAPPAPSEPRPSGSGATPQAAQSAPSSSARPEPASTPPRAAPAPPPRPLAPVDVEAAKANPLVQRAAELLNAKVVRITARPDAPPTQK